MPLLVIPIVADQIRNALAVEKHGVGKAIGEIFPLQKPAKALKAMNADKTDLAQVGPLGTAIREMLETNKYREAAKKVGRKNAQVDEKLYRWHKRSPIAPSQCARCSSHTWSSC